MREQKPRLLKPETINRFGREWDNRSKDKPFSIRARVRNDEEDIIEAHQGAEEWAPEGTRIRDIQDVFDDVQFTNSGDLIADNEMESDLHPR